MPKIHKYKDKASFYIRSTINGSITTYQVTEKGNNYLKSRGYKDKDDIDINSLMQLKDWNYVFTDGQGPGDIDTEQTYFNIKNYSYSNNSRTNAQLDNINPGCWVIIIIFIIMFIISLL